MVKYPIKILHSLLNVANVSKMFYSNFSFCLSPIVFISEFNSTAVAVSFCMPCHHGDERG